MAQGDIQDVRVFDGTKWESLIGPQGPAGADGPQGPQGEPGPSRVSAVQGNSLQVGDDGLLYCAYTPVRAPTELENNDIDFTTGAYTNAFPVVWGDNQAIGQSDTSPYIRTEFLEFGLDPIDGDVSLIMAGTSFDRTAVIGLGGTKNNPRLLISSDEPVFGEVKFQVNSVPVLRLTEGTVEVTDSASFLAIYKLSSVNRDALGPRIIVPCNPPVGLDETYANALFFASNPGAEVVIGVGDPASFNIPPGFEFEVLSAQGCLVTSEESGFVSKDSPELRPKTFNVKGPWGKALVVKIAQGLWHIEGDIEEVQIDGRRQQQ